MGNLRKLVVSFAVVGTAASISSLGTFASFTSTTSATGQSNSTGTVIVALGTAGTSANRLSVGATNIVPGDTIQRAFNVTNTGTVDFSSITLTTTAPTSSLLNTDVTNGLQYSLDRCTVPWTELAVGSGFTYTCLGTTTSVLTNQPVISSDVSIGSSALTVAGVDRYRVTLTLPAAAGNTFQGLTSVIDYTFTATQRNATDK